MIFPTIQPRFARNLRLNSIGHQRTFGLRSERSGPGPGASVERIPEIPVTKRRVPSAEYHLTATGHGKAGLG
jgi:hypothetical protein